MASFWNFCEYLFLQIASFWKFWAFKFHPQRKKNKKKIVKSRDIRQMFLSRSTERQTGQDGETCNWLVLKKAEWTNIFCAYFFRVYISAKYEFFAYLACIYFRKCRLKENFACVLFCKINQNSWNSEKDVHAISMLN